MGVIYDLERWCNFENDTYYYIFLFLSTICAVIIAISVMFFTLKIENTHRYDVNKDGTVNAKDYIEIKKYIMNKEKQNV